MFPLVNTTPRSEWREPTRETWREEIRKRGLTLAGLANLTGKTFRSVSAYSEGKRTPSDEWVAKVIEVIAALDAVAA